MCQKNYYNTFLVVDLNTMADRPLIWQQMICSFTVTHQMNVTGILFNNLFDILFNILSYLLNLFVLLIV